MLAQGYTEYLIDPEIVSKKMRRNFTSWFEKVGFNVILYQSVGSLCLRGHQLRQSFD